MRQKQEYAGRISYKTQGNVTDCVLMLQTDYKTLKNNGKILK